MSETPQQRETSSEYDSFIRSLYIGRYGMPDGFHMAQKYLAERGKDDELPAEQVAEPLLQTT